LFYWPAAANQAAGGIKPITTTGLSGTYTVYKFADTAFINNLRADGLAEITVETLYGDTTYSGFGAGGPHVGVNIIQNYMPSMIADTIVFKSATTGIESNFTDTTPITYSLSTGAFSDGSTDPTVVVKLTQIDATTIKIVAFQLQGSYTGDVQARFYRKQ
jgi:hypothetical protein